MQIEKDIETKLRKMVERHGGMCLKWVCPGWAGVPDRIVLLPGGRIIFIELKRPSGGRIASLQRWWRQRLKSLGFLCLLVSTDLGIAMLEEFIENKQMGFNIAMTTEDEVKE